MRAAAVDALLKSRHLDGNVETRYDEDQGDEFEQDLEDEEVESEEEAEGG